MQPKEKLGSRPQSPTSICEGGYTYGRRGREELLAKFENGQMEENL